jgi:hypothetical protein
MDLTISFNPTSELAYSATAYPEPAKEAKPEWYVSTKSFDNNDIEFDDKGNVNKTFKHCQPFADAFSMGYVQKTWQDISVSEIKTETGIALNCSYPTNPPIVGMRESSLNSIKIPEEYLDMELVWFPTWVPQVPKGYSVLITHPLNRFDLPFYTLSGVIDADTFTQASENSNLPFLLKKNFRGIIKKGTPMYQIIPFKRDSWTSSESEFNLKDQTKIVESVRQQFWGAYKTTYWAKKDFK